MGELIEYICDEVCKYPDKAVDQEELDVICANCEVYERLSDLLQEAHCCGILAGAQIGNDVASVGPIERGEEEWD